MKKLFVANLSYKTTSEELEEAFKECGEVVSAQVITDRETGRSRGFGFVEMGSSDEAQEAIKKMNGHKLSDRELAVKLAESKPQRSGPSRSFGGGRRQDSYHAF